MVRRIVAVLSSLVASGIVIALIEGAGHAQLRGEAMVGVAIVALGLGSAVGTVVATTIADRRIAIVVPVLLAVLASFNLFSFKHPLWFIPSAATALILGWWVGSIIGSALSNDARAGGGRR